MGDFGEIKSVIVADSEAVNIGQNIGQQQTIDKACEWISNNWREYINVDADGMICFSHWESDFRKAMQQ